MSHFGNWFSENTFGVAKLRRKFFWILLRNEAFGPGLCLHSQESPSFGTTGHVPSTTVPALAPAHPWKSGPEDRFVLTGSFLKDGGQKVTLSGSILSVTPCSVGRRKEVQIGWGEKFIQLTFWGHLKLSRWHLF